MLGDTVHPAKNGKKMLLLCSQALCIVRELYKLLAIVDHAYRPNLLLQSLLRMLKLCIKINSKMQYTYLKTSVNKVHGVCVLRALVTLCINDKEILILRSTPLPMQTVRLHV